MNKETLISEAYRLYKEKTPYKELEKELMYEIIDYLDIFTKDEAGEGMRKEYEDLTAENISNIAIDVIETMSNYWDVAEEHILNAFTFGRY